MGSDRRAKATLHDVAARVGVSPRTVSRVVNDEGGFSDDTRARVLEAISELDYRPNLLARGLVTSRSNTLALIVTVIDDPFFPELAQGVQLAAMDKGMTMFLAVSADQADLEEQLLNRMASQAIDGAILFPAADSTDGPLRYAGQGLPIVLIDDTLGHDNISSVRSDLEDGVRQAVEHLKGRGRTRLAMLTNGELQGRRRRRERAFREQRQGEAVIVESEPTYDGGYRAMERLLDQMPEVDGVFVYNDVMAIGAIDACKSRDLNIPQQISIVGCDDIEMSARVTPGLTTIRLDREALGFAAVNRLMELSESEVRPEPITVPVTLVVRESS